MLRKLSFVIGRIKSDDMARHGILMAAFGFALGLFNYLYQLAMGRMLQPEDYGILMSLTSLFLIISIFALVIRTVMSKFISRYYAEGNMKAVCSLWRFYLKRTLILGVALFAVAALLSPIVSGFLRIGNFWYPLTLFSALILAFAVPVNYGTLNGLHRFFHLGWTTTLWAVLKLLLAIVLIKLGFGLYGGLLPFLIAFIIIFAVTLALLKDLRGGSSGKVEIVGFRSYLGLSFIAILAYTVLTNIDVVLVKRFLSAEEAGNYAALAALGRAALFAPMGIALAMFPKTSGLHEMGKSHRSVLLMGVLLTLLISGVVVLVYWIDPEFVLGFLGRYESGALKYPMAADHLFKYSIAMLLFAVSYIVMNYFLSINRIRVAYPFMVTAFLQVVLIIYFHSGIAQVVNAILVSAAVCLIAVIAFYLFWIKRYVPPIKLITEEVPDG